MRLTLQTDYALRTMMMLAVSERQLTIDEIASHYDISRNHMMKVVQRLAALGYVKSVRGRNGGLTLARAPEDINLGAVMADVEELGSFVECFNPATNTCRASPACGLTGILSGGVKAMMAHYAQFTLADLTPKPALFKATMGLPT